MNILYIGSGFVGACSAAVAAASGHDVLIYDIDEKKVKALGSQDQKQIESCLYEKGLSDLLIRNNERIRFSTSYDDVEKNLNDCDAVFMCLPTPEIGETGESNLKYYFDAAQKLSKAMLKRNGGKQDKYIVIINKSTVPIDMVSKTEEMMEEVGVKNYGVVSNPEFLVEGKAVQGSLKPDRVVIGAWKEEDFKVMRGIYQRFYDSPTVKYIEVNPKEAAAGKLLANFYLFNRLQICFDVIGRTCETFDKLQFENLRKVLSSDPRIGNWGFFDSLYSGGSCFIKDSRSLSHQLQTAGQTAVLVDETYLANKRQLELFFGRAEKELDYVWKDKIVSLMGVAFKRDTNDIRNSASIEIVKFLQEKGVKKIKVYDPAAMKYFQVVYPASEMIEYCDSSENCIDGTDSVIIATDWPQFRNLGEIMLEKCPLGGLLMDGRRMIVHKYESLQSNGFDIIAVGSPLIKSNI